METGYRQVELDAIAIHSDEAGLAECFPHLDALNLQGLVASGHISKAEFNDLRAAHQTFITSDDPFALILLFIACCCKTCCMLCAASHSIAVAVYARPRRATPAVIRTTTSALPGASRFFSIISGFKDSNYWESNTACDQFVSLVSTTFR